MTVIKNGKISYSLSWEDADLMIKVLDIQKNDTVLSISSGGCNTLSIASQNPIQIYALDHNPSQNYLLELKLKAFRKLSYEGVREFLSEQGKNRLLQFEKLSSSLSSECRKYWLNNEKAIEKGVNNCGRFENYLRIFRQFVLPLTNSKSSVKELLREKPIQEQQLFYDTKWANARWHIIFKVFFSQALMTALGRGKNMFQFNKTNKVGQHYLQKTRIALTRTSVFNNPYLQYILTGKYITPPFYLRSENFTAISKSNSIIDIKTMDIFEFLKSLPENSIDKFNLSDIFESISPERTAEIFNEIIKKGRKKAKIIFWNNLVNRNVPTNLKSYFFKESSLEEALSAEEKVFFYTSLNIYTLRK